MIEPEELRSASKDSSLGLNSNFIDKAIARGDQTYGAFDGTKLVSYIWRSAGCAPDADGVWVRVRKPYNYSYKSFTRPEYRGQGISPVAHLFSDNEMHKQGYRYRAGFVSIANYASLRMGKKMGSQRIGYAGYFAGFGRLMPFRTRAVREIGFEFFRPKDAP
jgi:GNAT superfamily N-acetyltransferase